MRDRADQRQSRWDGLLQIAYYNWHFYAIAGALELTAALVVIFVPLPLPVRLSIIALSVPGLIWSVGSLVVSHYIYDRSELYKWLWLDSLNIRPHAWINIHAGLDDTSNALASLYGTQSRSVLDIYDPKVMPEPSIARARRKRRDTRSEPADFRRLPVESAKSDAVFLIFAAHELRSSASKAALFAEVHRVLRPGGHVILVEHARDGWNFAAFGPGFWHFFSARTWRRVLAGARLPIRKEFCITPFVHVFVAEAA